MRVRDSTTTQTLNVVGRQYGYTNNIVYTGTTPVTGKTVKYMEDVVTPDFQKKSGVGQIFINQMMKCTSSAPAMTQGSWSCGGKPNALGQRQRWENSPDYIGTTINASYQALPAVVRAKVDTLTSLAVTKAASRVNAATVESLVTLAELKETLEFLKSPVDGIVALTKRAGRWLDYYERSMQQHERRMARFRALPEHLRKGAKMPKPPQVRPFKVGKFSATTIPSLWLAYRYGLMPLIYEYEAYSKLLADKGKPPRETARAKEEDTVSYVNNTSGYQGDDLGTGRIFVERDYSVDCQITVRAGFLYEVDWSLQNQMGLGLDRIPVAIYERIPLSFVADWFWNGAEYYSALTAECRAKRILGGWSVATVSYLASSTTRISSAGLNTVMIGTPVFPSTTESGTIIIRTPRTLADVDLKLRLELNTKRIADGLALAFQFISGRRKS